MTYIIWQYWLLSTSFILIIHLESVPYDNMCCPAPLLRPPSIFEESEFVARMENWGEQWEGIRNTR